MATHISKMGNATTSENSTDSESFSSVAGSSTSPLRSPDTTVNIEYSHGAIPRTAKDKSQPYLAVIEQPVDKFRFRYKTEMQGCHGAIMGEGSVGKRKNKSWPTVQLCNYKHVRGMSKPIIRCTLSTVDGMESERVNHVHRLIGKSGGKEEDDPVDVIVHGPEYKAVFQNMTIIFTKKPDHLKVLTKKKIRHTLTTYTDIADADPMFMWEKEKHFEKEAQLELNTKFSKSALNKVCLKFEALIDSPLAENGRLQLLCPPVYSHPITNMKNASHNELRICRQDKWVGKPKGGDEVWILVEKVQKENIKIKFYEFNEFGEIIWEDWGIFHPNNVHHQFAIVFETPPYRDPDIKNEVSVKFQLYRPEDEASSEPRDWLYKPDQDLVSDLRRKKARISEPQPKLVSNVASPSSTMVEPLTATCNNPIQPADIQMLDLMQDIISGGPEMSMSEQIVLSNVSSNPSFMKALEDLKTPDAEDVRSLFSSDDFQDYMLLNDLQVKPKETISEESNNSFDGVHNSFKGYPHVSSSYPETGLTQMRDDRNWATHQMSTSTWIDIDCELRHAKQKEKHSERLCDEFADSICLSDQQGMNVNFIPESFIPPKKAIGPMSLNFMTTLKPLPEPQVVPRNPSKTVVWASKTPNAQSEICEATHECAVVDELPKGWTWNNPSKTKQQELEPIRDPEGTIYFYPQMEPTRVLEAGNVYYDEFADSICLSNPQDMNITFIPESLIPPKEAIGPMRLNFMTTLKPLPEPEATNECAVVDELPKGWTWNSPSKTTQELKPIRDPEGKIYGNPEIPKAQMDSGWEARNANYEFKVEHQCDKRELYPEGTIHGQPEMAIIVGEPRDFKWKEKPSERLAQKRNASHGRDDIDKTETPRLIPKEITEDNCIELIYQFVRKLLAVKTHQNWRQIQTVLERLFMKNIGETESSLFHVLVKTESKITSWFIEKVKESDLSHVLDKTNIFGETALHLAVQSKSSRWWDDVYLLLGANASLNIKDNNGVTPFMMLVTRQTPEHLITYLLERTFNLGFTIFNKQGYSALHLLVLSENKEVLEGFKTLIRSWMCHFRDEEHFSNVLNMKDKRQGFTALHLAVSKRYTECVEFLLGFNSSKYGTKLVDVDETDFSGNTPLSLVYSSSHPEDRKIVSLLLGAGADPSLIKKSEIEDEESDEEKDGESTPKSPPIEEILRGMEKVEIKEELDNSDDEQYQECKSDSATELREVLDRSTVSKLCSLLDKDNGWQFLALGLDFTVAEIDQCAMNSSSTAICLQLCLNKPEVTAERIKSVLSSMPPEFQVGADYIKL